MLDQQCHRFYSTHNTMTATANNTTNESQGSESHMAGGQRRSGAKGAFSTSSRPKRGHTPRTSSSSSSTSSSLSSSASSQMYNLQQESSSQNPIFITGDNGGHVLPRCSPVPQSRDVFQHSSPNALPPAYPSSHWRHSSGHSQHFYPPVNSFQEGAGDCHKPSLPGIGSLLNGIAHGNSLADSNSMGHEGNVALPRVLRPHTPARSPVYNGVLPTPSSLPPIGRSSSIDRPDNEREQAISNSALLASQALTEMPNQRSYPYLMHSENVGISNTVMHNGNLVHAYSGYTGVPDNQMHASAPTRQQQQQQQQQQPQHPQFLGPPANIISSHSNENQNFQYPQGRDKNSFGDVDGSHRRSQSSGSIGISQFGNDHQYYMQYQNPPYNQLFHQQPGTASPISQPPLSLTSQQQYSYENGVLKPQFFQRSSQTVKTEGDETKVAHGHNNFSFCRPMAQAPLMSVRRDIKRRTKTGCLTCRKRRIKCDEHHPTCRNCEKSKRICLGYDPVFKYFSERGRHKGLADDSENNSGVDTPFDSPSRLRPEESSGSVSPLDEHKDSCDRIRVESLLAAAVSLEEVQANSKEWTWPTLYQYYQENIAAILDDMFGSRKFKTMLILRGPPAGEFNENLIVLEVIRQIVAHLKPDWNLEQLRVDETKVHKMEELRITDNYKLIRCVAQFMNFSQSTEYLEVGDNYTDSVIFDRIRMLHQLVLVKDYSNASASAAVMRGNYSGDNWSGPVKDLVSKCLGMGDVDLIWTLVGMILKNSTAISEDDVNQFISGFVDNPTDSILSPKTASSPSSQSSAGDGPHNGPQSSLRSYSSGVSSHALTTTLLLAFHYCCVKNNYGSVRRIRYFLEEARHGNCLLDCLINIAIKA